MTCLVYCCMKNFEKNGINYVHVLLIFHRVVQREKDVNSVV